MMVCSECGSTLTDAEIVAMRKANPKLIKCCPDRNMVEQPADDDPRNQFRSGTHRWRG